MLPVPERRPGFQVALEPLEAGQELDASRERAALADPEIVIDLDLSATNTHMTLNGGASRRDTVRSGS